MVREDPRNADVLYVGTDLGVYVSSDRGRSWDALVAGLPVLVTSTCGYAWHIEAAGCGTVLPAPFEQAALNTAVRRSLDAEFLQQCRERALAYADSEDLYSMHSTGAALIERFVAAVQGDPHE